MARFLIEVAHENRKAACDSAVRTFLETGSHFLANADWGCGDGEHKAWFVADLASRDEAMAALPPHLRRQAKVIALQKFTMQDVDLARGRHHN